MKIILVLVVTAFIAIKAPAQIRQSYINAAKLYREAASKTKCPVRAQYLNNMASYCDCLADGISRGSMDHCRQPSGQEPACPEDGGEGGSTNGSVGTGSSSVSAAKPSSSQQLSAAANATLSTIEQELAAGRKMSGAVFSATLAGASEIVDPKLQMGYTAAGGLASAAFYFKERKEEKAAARLQELQQISATVASGGQAFSFIEGSTRYHITRLGLVRKKNGKIKAIEREDLYDVMIVVNEVRNTSDKLIVIETNTFRNKITGRDSIVLYRITIPFRSIESADVYTGDYLNDFNEKADAYENLRFLTLDNEKIEFAFSYYADYPVIPSGLKDVMIKTRDSDVGIQTKVLKTNPSYSDFNFNNIPYRYGYNYVFVFDEFDSSKAKNLADYLTFISKY